MAKFNYITEAEDVETAKVYARAWAVRNIKVRGDNPAKTKTIINTNVKILSATYDAGKWIITGTRSQTIGAGVVIE